MEKRQGGEVKNAVVLQNKKPSFLILLILVSFASICAVLFTPALPEIAKELHLTNSQAQLTITSFLIGYAIGNLPYGPISNRWGRKPAAFMGIALAAIGSFLICLVSGRDYFWLFILGRFFMALGSSVGIKISFTMIGDMYSGFTATKKITYLMLAFAVGPGLAIALGGFLTGVLGWKSCFYFLTGYSAFVFVLVNFLPETLKQEDKKCFNLINIRDGYLSQLRNRKLVFSSLLMGCATSVIYLFAAEAPFIGIDYIGLSTELYGVLNFIPPIGMIVGSLFANYLADKKSPLSVIILGIWIVFIISVMMLGVFLLGEISWWCLFFPMPLIYIGDSLIFSNSSSLVMTHAKDKSNASAIMNFINISTSVIALFLVGLLPFQSVNTLPLAFVFLGMVMLFLKRRLNFVMQK